MNLCGVGGVVGCVGWGVWDGVFCKAILIRACGVPVVVVGLLTAGNDIVGTILISHFHFLLPFLRCYLFSLKDQKTYLAKVAKNLGVDIFPYPVGHFWAPLAAILDFAGVAVV